MYRGRFWTMRQYAGFASAEESNRRYKFLLDQGQTGLSVAFDLPTQIGYDSDHELSLGEVGKVGVAIDSLPDMETLFDGIPLDKVSTSMTINAPAAVLLAMYIAVAEKQGVTPEQLRGTIQNDILKEYSSRGTYIFPPQPSMRIITDIFAYCSQEVPAVEHHQHQRLSHPGSRAPRRSRKWPSPWPTASPMWRRPSRPGWTWTISARGCPSFSTPIWIFWRKWPSTGPPGGLWARIMKERFGAKDPSSMMMRFHTQTAGCTLTAQQPNNNIVRVAFQALAAVLGGTQSLHTNSMDEALALPTEQAVQIALRTQQIIAYETGVAETVDPLAGSYYIENLTNEIEEQGQRRTSNKSTKWAVRPRPSKTASSSGRSRTAHTSTRRRWKKATGSWSGINKFKVKEDSPRKSCGWIPRCGNSRSRRLKKLKAERRRRPRSSPRLAASSKRPRGTTT